MYDKISENSEKSADEDLTTSYSSGGPADSGDIGQYHKPTDKLFKRKRMNFKDFLEMKKKKKKKKEEEKEGELVSQCIVCEREYDRKPAKEKKFGGISSGLCKECLDEKLENLKKKKEKK